jgi:hypothetical protein
MSEQKATSGDAGLIIKLYDLRREPEMRKARNFVLFEFWPESFDDMFKLAMAMGSPENAWFRQVTSYWDMACTFVLQGALNPDLFLANSQEMFTIFAKVRPFLNEGRTRFNSPEFMRNMEKVIESTPEGRARLSATEQRIQAFRDVLRSKKAQAS